MTCPRCERPTDRTTSVTHYFAIGPWNYSDKAGETNKPLICTRCLTDWRLRVVTGSLMLLPPKEAAHGDR